MMKPVANFAEIIAVMNDYTYMDYMADRRFQKENSDCVDQFAPLLLAYRAPCLTALGSVDSVIQAAPQAGEVDGFFLTDGTASS